MECVRSIVSTLGDPTVTHIFLHDATALLRTVPGDARPRYYRSYDQRALLVARPHDVVCVASRKTDPSYSQFLFELGVGPKSDHIIELNAGSDHEERSLSDLLLRRSVLLGAICKLVPSANRVLLNPYSVSETDHVLAHELAKVLGRSVTVLGGNPEVAASANLKHVAYCKAQELGIPVAEGEVVELRQLPCGHPKSIALLQSAISRHVHDTGRVIIRGTDGISGSATITVGNDAESQREGLEALMRKPHSPVYLVQVRHEIVTSPNIQVFVQPDNGTVEVASVSDQRLDDCLKHIGNVVPSSAATLADMIRSAETFARWLQQDGFTGLVGFDFVEYVDPQTGRARHVLAEANARANAATYPSFVMEHVNERQRQRGFPPVGAYCSGHVTVRAQSFPELCDEYRNWLFNPRTGRGMVPYNLCSGEKGCTMAFYGPSRAEVEEMPHAFISEAKCRTECL